MVNKLVLLLPFVNLTYILSPFFLGGHNSNYSCSFPPLPVPLASSRWVLDADRLNPYSPYYYMRINMEEYFNKVGVEATDDIMEP